MHSGDEFDEVVRRVVAQLRNHKDAHLTMRLYAHSQFAALRDAGASLDRVVTLCDTEARPQAR